jgi:hypothetical protein
VSKIFSFFLILCTIVITSPSFAQEPRALFQEDFNSLDNWKPLHFPKIKRHSEYSIVKEKDNALLKTVSNNSASGIVYQNNFNVYDYPLVKWRWKIENVYQKGDPKIKQGDDYPIRIYIIFKYEPEASPFFERVKYEAARLVYGDYPPDSSLNYIWSSKEHPERILGSTYTAKAQMVLIDKGEKDLGKWITHEINIIKDYQEAFGHNPPAIASLAIMNDSDNTGEKSISYIDYIKVFN